MKRWAKFFTVCVLVLTLKTVAFSQETSVEEAYMNKSPEIMIIHEQASLNDRDAKFLALEYIHNLIDAGKKTDDIRLVLNDLALEGVLNKFRSDGRTANNFPDIRIKAVSYLGELSSKEAHDSLIRIMLVENEPSVITEAIHSLTKIGINDNDDTLNAIQYIFNIYDAKKPDNVLALSVVDAFSAFTGTSGTKNPNVYRTLLSISSNPSYAKPVRNYSAKVLSNLYKFAAQ